MQRSRQLIKIEIARKLGLAGMAGVRRVVPLTLGWIDLPRHVLVRDDSDEQVRVPVPGALLQADGGWLLLDTGFNTALITDAALRRRFHGYPALRPIIPGPGEPLDEGLDKVGVGIAEIRAVAVSHLHSAFNTEDRRLTSAIRVTEFLVT
jgi:N-acyl homoserine lactone hydrolase